MSKIIIPPVTNGCFRAMCICGCLFDVEKNSCEVLHENTSKQYDRCEIDGEEKVIGWTDVKKIVFSCDCPSCGKNAIGEYKKYGEFHLTYKFNK